MRARLTVLLAAALVVLAAPAAAHGADLFRSPNVQRLGHLPEATGAIGAKFSRDGRAMFVTAATGLFTYDVSDPARPQRLAALPLPHFENEDVDMGRVAGREVLVITNDPSFSTVGVIYVIDVTDPAAPRILSATPTAVPVAGDVLGLPGSSNGHISNCIQGCRYIWTTGSSEGLTVYDLADPARPRHLGAFQIPGGGFTHDVQVDGSGIAWVTGEDGTFGYDVGRIANPLAPRLLYRSDPSVTNTGNSGPSTDPGGANDSPLDFLHHNSLRVGKRTLAVTEEDYLRPGCNGQGSLQTWRITGERNPDGTIKLALQDLWTTELNELLELEGRSNEQGVPTTVNCSAHWFDESGGIVAQGWYDQGVRFLDISDPTDIHQVGYWVTTGEFWAAYYAPLDPAQEIVYALDTTGGIDVLRLDRGERLTRRAPVRDAWRRPSARVPHPVF